MNKMLVFFLFFTFSTSVLFAQEEEEEIHRVECSIEAGCVSVENSSGSEVITEKSTYTSFDFGPQTKDVEIVVPNNQRPKNLRMNINLGEFPGKSLTVDLSSQDESSNSGEVILLADNIDNLNVILNGYNGERGKDATEICAERFKDGTFGANALAFFNNRRSTQNSSADPNRCDSIDINFLEEFNFFCQDPSFNTLEGSQPTIEIARIRRKARCSAVLVRDECLKRKRTINCRYRQWGTFCSGSKGGYRCVNRHTGATTYKQAVIADLFYLDRVSALGQTNFCYQNVGGRVWGWEVVDVVGNGYTSPGIDSITGQPLPGSDWEFIYTLPYGSCPAYWAYQRTSFTNEITFDENDNRCDDVGISEDPNNILSWQYIGMAQEPDFGTQLIPCSPGNCPIQTSISELDNQILTVNPTDGKDGTQRGKALILAYDVNEKSISAVNGQSGAGGKNDFTSQESTRYCFKKRDADTDGILSEFAQDPSVTFIKYRWKPLRSELSGNPGNPPNNPNNTVEIYTKLSDSVRFLIQDALL
jgi:hypothetical protein